MVLWCCGAVELNQAAALSQRAQNKGAALPAQLWPSAASSWPAAEAAAATAVAAGKVRPQPHHGCGCFYNHCIGGVMVTPPSGSEAQTGLCSAPS